MKYKFVFTIIIQFVLFIKLDAQVNRYSINIYISQKNYDSVKHELNLFISEVNKVKKINFKINSIEENKNDGILFVKIDNVKHNLLKKFDFRNQEAFYFECSTKKVTIISSFALGFKRALIYYLDKMGFYYYAPMPEWHIKPLQIRLFGYNSEFVSPSFFTRTFFIGHGMGPKSKAIVAFDFWKQMNNVNGGIITQTDHVYQDIVERNKPEFLRNTNYLINQNNKINPLVNPKFNLLDENVVKLVLEDSRKRIELDILRNGHCDMISMEPSDGNGFENASEKLKLAIGDASNQTYWLANKVAEYNKLKYPKVLYGLLAYNNHILPPTFPIDKNIFIAVTNGFNFTEKSIPEILQLYKHKVKHLGFYEYLDVYDWTLDLPGLSVSSSYTKVEKNIKMAYSNGVRYFHGESSSGWINRLLGHYILTKKLWNININAISIKEKLLNDCFGNVKSIIAPIFESWSQNNAKVLNEYETIDWYYTLLRAKKLANNDVIKLRIDDVINYVKYLILYNEVKKNNSLETLNNILSFARNHNNRPVFATFQCLNVLANQLGYKNMGFWEDKNYKDSVENISFVFPEIGDNKYPLQNNETFSLQLLQNRKYSFENNLTFFVTKTDSYKAYIIITPYKFEGVVQKLPTTISINSKKIKELVFNQRGQPDTIFLNFKSLNINIDDDNRLYTVEFSKNLNVSINLNKSNYIITNSISGYYDFKVSWQPNIKNICVVKNSFLKIEQSDNKTIELTKNNSETRILKNDKHNSFKILNQNGFLKLH